MSPDASQHDLSLLIASGNATETQILVELFVQIF
jgi:hypothetical protein